jgi:hypothetical protein
MKYRVSRRMRWEGHAAHIQEMRNAYKILVGKLKGKIPLGRSRCRWEHSMRMNLKVIECECVNWIDLPQGRLQWYSDCCEHRALVSLKGNFLIE